MNQQLINIANNLRKNGFQGNHLFRQMIDEVLYYRMNYNNAMCKNSSITLDIIQEALLYCL